MNIDIPLPRLLNSDGTERRIRPGRVSVDLRITPLSYATIELPVGESLPARGFIELYTILGSAGIYRVRSPQDAYGDNTATAELEHAIVEVGDWVIQGDLDDMMSASAAMTAVFGHYRGTLWQLGSVSALGDDLIAVQQHHSRVLEAMLAIMDQRPDCMLTFDFSTSPWTVGVAQRGMEVSAEGRLARNVTGAKIIYDDTELCTRAFYEIPASTDASSANFPAFDVNLYNSAGTYVIYSGKLYRLPAGHDYGVAWENTTKEAVTDAPTTTWTSMDADTIGQYGVIEREVPTGRDYTLEEANRAAAEYLRQHKNPRISVEIDGEALSYITGEPLDTFAIGKLFRLALPDYNTTVERNITAMSFPNVYDTPEIIVVDLAEEEETAVTYLHDLDAKGGYGGGSGGRREEDVWKEFRTAIEKTDYYLDLYARQYKQTEEIVRQAGLYIDANGTLLYADDYENAVGAKLRVLSDEISSSVSAASSTIYSEIVQTASSITSVIVDTEQNLFTYIQQTASGLRQRMASTTSRTWIQDSDPRTGQGGSHTPKEGDIWIESTHQGTWDGADGFDWEHDEDYDWNQIQGAKVWGWANGKWELVSDQQQVVSYADVVETAEHYLSLRIKGIVNDEGFLEVYLSKLEQTGDELKSEIYGATSQLYSFIDQTVSNINMGVGSRAVTVMQKGQPEKIYGRDPVNNDVWIETNDQESWDKALDFSWNDDYEVNWNELRSDRIWVYKAGEGWVLAMDGTVLTEDTDLQITSNHIALLARNIDTLDGYARENYAALKVEASKISSTVLDKTNELGSRITQTATQIRSEVHAANSQVYSEITQTASQIRLFVNNSISGVQSSITQTANQIRSEVKASSSATYSQLSSAITQTASQIRLEVNASISGTAADLSSAITQTASQIRLYVNSSISNVHSAITVQSNRISLVVEGTGANAKIKPASIVASINNGESSIVISANHVGLSGYVKATDLTATYFKSKISTIDTVNVKQLYSQGSIQCGSLYYTDALIAIHTGVWDVKIVQDGNDYKLQKYQYNGAEWVDCGTFSRATSLSGAWSSGTLTVTATPQGNTFVVGIGARFGVSEGTYYIEASKTQSGSTTGISGTNTTIKLGRSGNAVQIQNSSGNRIADTPVLTLTTHSNAVDGLTRAMVNGSPIHAKLYYLDGGIYKEVTGSARYWYYRTNSMAPTTLYS